MSTAGIVLTPELTSELAEFWGLKYKEVKQELDALKGAEDNTPTYGELKRLVQQLQAEAVDTARRLESKDKYLFDFIAATRSEQKVAQEKLEACNAEKAQLLAQLARSDNERVALYHQIQVSYSQAASLAAEVNRRRMDIIAELFPPTSFFDDSFTPVVFNSARRVVRALSQESNGPQSRLYLLPRPPTSIPLRVPSFCQAGYWFHPFDLSPMDSPFELIVEVGSDIWLYFGRYVTRRFPGYDMKLSEWITFDEQIKMVFCARIASQSMPLGQDPSHAAEVNVRQRYDSGQWSAPCYTLQCVGFDMTLHDALTTKLRCESEIPNPPSLGKRRRAETPSCCGSVETEGSVRPEGFAKKVRPEPHASGVEELIAIQVKGE
ncbi:hypothetical protein FB451DRAFT_632489 [Mycena latifolia]|nr:hypothetical protein FB451DRAFT_632489 [Mycena latifolia]